MMLILEPEDSKCKKLWCLNGHCFVSLMLCVPVWNHDKMAYLAVPLGYRMWQKKESNLNLIGNARADSVIYDLAPAPTGRNAVDKAKGKEKVI